MNLAPFRNPSCPVSVEKERHYAGERRMNEYMAAITFLEEANGEFVALIPFQRALVNELMAKGIITSYSLSAEREFLWVTLVAASEEDAFALIKQMPLYKFMDVTIHELMFHNSPITQPRITLN
jgi:muconolactone delta-isomerase